MFGSAVACMQRMLGVADHPIPAFVGETGRVIPLTTYAMFGHWWHQYTSSDLTQRHEVLRALATTGYMNNGLGRYSEVQCHKCTIVGSPINTRESGGQEKWAV